MRCFFFFFSVLQLAQTPTWPCVMAVCCSPTPLLLSDAVSLVLGVFLTIMLCSELCQIFIGTLKVSRAHSLWVFPPLIPCLVNTSCTSAHAQLHLLNSGSPLDPTSVFWSTGSLKAINWRHLRTLPIYFPSLRIPMLHCLMSSVLKTTVSYILSF